MVTISRGIFKDLEYKSERVPMRMSQARDTGHARYVLSQITFDKYWSGNSKRRLETGNTIQYAGVVSPDRNDRYTCRDREN